MFGFLKPKANKYDANEELTSHDIVEKYRDEIKNIEIENQPFRLSGMLHILTNKVSDLLQSSRHVIYYDIESDVGRYIVGDNDYIEQVLEILVKDALLLNMDHAVILKISKLKNKFLVFEVINEKGLMKKEVYKQYLHVERVLQKLNQNTNAFAKAKKIAEAMNGSIVLKSARMSGTHYTFQIPFYEDKDCRSNQEALKTFLKGKKALFIGKDKHDTIRAQYIFETYGIHINNITLNDFEKKRPDFGKYNMVIIRSEDLSYRHISFFKNIYQDEKSNFKIIIVHELFESEEKILLSKSIAHAELYNPTVIGDVEEILYQMFILKSNAVKGISNMAIFDSDTFTIKGSNSKAKEDDSDWYRGAHIAIVEDSKVDQRIIENILKLDGVTIFCLHNGAEMLELIETEEIDIIFTDINMPIMDGLLMTKNIRAKKKWEHIPIISISSMAFPHEIEEMKDAGMNAAISKPIEAKEVYAALDIFLVMTAKIRNRKVSGYKVKFSYNKEILDIEKGLKETKSEAQYQENLLETMKMLKGTREIFEKLIYEQQYTALSKFARSTLSLYEDIHASVMMEMFKELIHFVSQGQKVYLIDYIYLYQKNWKKLEKEVKQYMDNIQN